LLIITTCCAVIAAIVKCETDARRNFAAKVAIVDAALGKTVPEVENQLYDGWVRKTRLVNPTVAAWEREMKSRVSKEERVAESVYRNGKVNRETDKFGYSCEWTIIRSMDSILTDYSTQPFVNPKDVIHIDVKVICSRPCSLISRTTSVTIEAHPAPDNKMLIDRLQAELDQAGVRYEITGYR